MTTVRELSDKLNVSRVSLYAILKKDPFCAHVVRGDNDVIFVSEQGINLLSDYYISKLKGGAPRGANGNGAQSAHHSGENGADSGSASRGVINILHEQLAKKDEQINSLLNIVQQLHA
jgi:hypothetical protein